MLALVAAVVVAGCADTGGGGEPAAADVDGAGDGGMTATAAATAAGDGTPREEDEASNGRAAAVDGRAKPALIKTGTVVLEVDEFDPTREALVAAVRQRGGYVSDSGVTRHREDNRTWRTGYVVLRVPSARFTDLLATTRGEGTVLDEETRTRDVSDKLVDLEARLENLRAKRDRLRTFYDRANSTQELLAVQEELSEVQGEIERLEAKKRALEDKVAYSTLRVEMREPAPVPTPTPTPTPEPKYHEQPLSAAFAASVDQLVVFGRSAVVTLAYALPYLLVFGVPLGIAGALVRKRGLR